MVTGFWRAPVSVSIGEAQWALGIHCWGCGSAMLLCCWALDAFVCVGVYGRCLLRRVVAPMTGIWVSSVTVAWVVGAGTGVGFVLTGLLGLVCTCRCCVSVCGLVKEQTRAALAEACRFCVAGGRRVEQL